MTRVWPKGAQAAISLSFDDGLQSQLDHVVPMLNQHGLRGTFYLNPHDLKEKPYLPRSWQDEQARWQPVAAAGHEIGNHTIMHPCSLNIDVSEWTRNLFDWKLEEYEADLDEAQHRIQQAFPQQRHTSFAYPCYETSIGRGEQRVSVIPSIARRFIAARVRGEQANQPGFTDLHHLSSWPVEHQTSAYMIGLAVQTAQLGRWGIFTFHGIDEGHLAVSRNNFEEFVTYLANNTQYWVAPVAEIAAYLAGGNS